MSGRNIITKIALGVAAAAFIFSLITLIRAIVVGVGVPFAAIQVIGTLIIVAICAIMLYVLRNEDPEEDEEAPEEDEDAREADAADKDEAPEDAVTDTEDKKADAYDFETFE